MYYVYRHIRPDLNVPFYIGIGTKNESCTGSTIQSEYGRAFNKKARSDFWNRVFNKCNKNIEVEIIYESDSVDEIVKKEIEFISLYGKRSQSGPLVNIMDGGQNPKHSEETKEKMRKACLGRPVSEEAKRKISAANKGKVGTMLGRKMSDESRLKISNAKKGLPSKNKGIKASSEHIKKLSDIQKARYLNGAIHPFLGRHHSDDTKNKISLANKGNKVWLGKKHSPESIIKIGAASKGRMLGRNVSDETKLKMSIASKGKVKSPETKLKISLAKKGKPSTFKGKKLSDEAKNKISIAAKERYKTKPTHWLGRRHSQATKDKISNTKRNKNG